MAGHPHFRRGQTPVLKSMYSDSKRLCKILHICKRSTVLLSGEEVKAELHHTGFTCVCHGAQPTPGDDLGLGPSLLYLSCFLDGVEARCRAVGETGLLTAAERRGLTGSREGLRIPIDDTLTLEWPGQVRR